MTTSDMIRKLCGKKSMQAFVLPTGEKIKISNR